VLPLNLRLIFESVVRVFCTVTKLLVNCSLTSVESTTLYETLA
jgi:hypothetical protein